MSQPRMIAERYEVLAEIGRGGMGVVARAFDHRLQTEVAIKILRRDLTAGAAETDSLIKEARVLARLTHPSVVRLFDLAETEFGLMLVLEYVRGPNLAQVLKARSKLNETELIFVMRQVCSGLDAAHAEGIVHRDLKPPNLLVSADAAAWESFNQGVCTSSFLLNSKVKITDFGISKLKAARMEATLAAVDSGATFASAGTPSFMSPEQFEGQPSTPATDIYALGVLAYQALSGALPFIGDTVESLARQHLSVAPKPLEHCSPRINKAIVRAMAKAPGDRFPSAGAFLAALEGTDAPANLPTFEPDPLDRMESWAKSHKLLLLCICLLLLAIPVAAFFSLIHSTTHSNPQMARDSNGSAAAAAPPDLGKRINLPVDLDLVSEIKSLPAALPVPLAPVHPGPQHPEIAWTALIDTEYEQTPWVDGVGADGTVYIRENQSGSLWAIRDGSLHWGFRYSTQNASALSLIDWQSHADFRDPGRLWLAWCPSRRTNYCGGSVFNAEGAGGYTRQVPAGFGLPVLATGVTRPFSESDAQNWRWPDRNGHLLCTSRLNAVSLTDQDKHWSVPLDGRATLAIEQDQNLIVATKNGAIYALDKDGEIRWKTSVDAEPDNLQLVPSGDLIVLEKGRESLSCLRQGKLLWKYKPEVSISTFTDRPADASRFAVADMESTIYFTMEGAFSGTLGTETLAIDRAGKLLWTLPWAGHVSNPGLTLDSRGRLFLDFEGYQVDKRFRGGVICIADSK